MFRVTASILAALLVLFSVVQSKADLSKLAVGDKVWLNVVDSPSSGGWSPIEMGETGQMHPYASCRLGNDLGVLVRITDEYVHIQLLSGGRGSSCARGTTLMIAKRRIGEISENSPGIKCISVQ